MVSPELSCDISDVPFSLLFSIGQWGQTVANGVRPSF